MTVQIALCDDERADLEKTERLLSACGQNYPESDFVIQCFEDTDELLSMVKESNYLPDLVFLDIYMPGKQGENMPLGMEVARKLREIGSGAKLIFLTASKEHALEAFDVEASGYLVKPLSKGKLCSRMDMLLEKIEQERKKYILLKRAEKIIKVSLNDVVYCEAQRKQQYIYMADGTELVQSLTLEKIYSMCSVCREFVRIGSSYIVNLEHIDSMNAQEVNLDNGRTIYLPRGAYRCLREQYLDYYCGKG